MKDFLDELDMEVQAIIPEKKQDTGVQKLPAEKNTPARPMFQKKPLEAQAVKHHNLPTVKNTQVPPSQAVKTGERSPQAETRKPQHPQRTQHPARNQQNRTHNKSSDTQDEMDRPHSKYGKKVIQFPETKFFLPALREGYTRYIPI